MLAAADRLQEITAWTTGLEQPAPLGGSRQKEELARLWGSNALEMLDSAKKSGFPAELLLQATAAELIQHDFQPRVERQRLPADESLSALESRTDQWAREAVRDVLGPAEVESATYPTMAGLFQSLRNFSQRLSQRPQPGE